MKGQELTDALKASLADTLSDEQKVKSAYPHARTRYVNCGMGSSYMLVMDGTVEIGRAYCGAMSDASAWRDTLYRMERA